MRNKEDILLLVANVRFLQKRGYRHGCLPMFFQDVAGQARYGKVGSALYTDGSDRFFGTMTSALLALRHDVDRDGSQEHQTLDGLHDCGIDTHDGEVVEFKLQAGNCTDDHSRT